MPKKHCPIGTEGLNVIGYFLNMIGIAEVGRFFIRHLVDMHFPHSLYFLHSNFHQLISPEEQIPLLKKRKLRPSFRHNLFFCNADSIPYFNKINAGAIKGTFNTGVFWWEFDDYFDFPQAFNFIDDVLVFSSFVKTAVAKSLSGSAQVRQLVFPYYRNWNITRTRREVRQDYQLNDDDFVIFFNFDLYSSYERKNPLGLLSAFSAAFLRQKDTKLVFKIAHAKSGLDNIKELHKMVLAQGLQGRVIFEYRNFSKNEYMNLLAATDAYVSLHRSEGFGIGMLEAMFLGLPVVATNYGGNTDFMNEDNSLPLTFSKTEVRRRFGPYRQGWLWAEPNLEQAVELMRRLYRDRGLALKLGERGRQFAEKAYSPESIQKQISSYFQEKPAVSSGQRPGLLPSTKRNWGIQRKEQPLIIFGTGSLALWVLLMLHRERFQIVCFFDNRPKTRTFFGKRVKKPVFIAEAKVIIASIYYKSIRKQLLGLGFQKRNLLCLAEKEQTARLNQEAEKNGFRSNENIDRHPVL